MVFFLLDYSLSEKRLFVRSLDTGPESYVGKIQSLSYYFIAEGTHRPKNGICKRGINLLPEKDNISSSGRNLSG